MPLQQSKIFIKLAFFSLLSTLLFQIAVFSETETDQEQIFTDIGGGAHYKNILIGGRAATMGGAFSAISDDASGVYYNPAGLVYVPYSTFSGSSNTFHVSRLTFENAVGKNNWERESKAIKANFFSLVLKSNQNFVWALSYVVPRAQVEDQHEAFMDFNGQGQDLFFNYHDQDTLTYMGPSVSYKLRDDFSIGLSLYYFYRNRKYSANQLLLTNKVVEQWVTQDRVVEVEGVLPILGVMYSPIEKVSIGLTARTHLTSDKKSKIDRNSASYRVNNSSASLLTLYQPDLTYSVTYPTQYTLGLAYFASSKLILSTDFDYYYFDDSSKLKNKDYKNMYNVSAGLEYFFKPKQAIRLGVFTNNTNSKKPYINTEDASKSSEGRRAVDLVGFTLGYSIYQNTNHLTIGVVYSAGTGKAQVNADNAISEYKKSELSLILSAGFGF